MSTTVFIISIPAVLTTSSSLDVPVAREIFKSRAKIIQADDENMMKLETARKNILEMWEAVTARHREARERRPLQ